MDEDLLLCLKKNDDACHNDDQTSEILVVGLAETTT
jgi:hypothetical protein